MLSDGTQHYALHCCKNEQNENIKYFIAPSGNRTRNRRAYNRTLVRQTLTTRLLQFTYLLKTDL